MDTQKRIETVQAMMGYYMEHHMEDPKVGTDFDNAILGALQKIEKKVELGLPLC